MTRGIVKDEDRILAIPLIVYFWWYKWKQKRGDTEEES
jgi:hypothetical protein